jgi:predicted nuclease of predicted toxin-antitoxin system
LKFLLDSCVSGRLKATLQEAGHDVEWCGDWPSDPGDDAVLAHAHAHGRTLITLDKDFGELAVVRDLPHAGIVRLAGLGLAMQAQVLLEVIRRHGAGLERGAIVTATSDRLRVRDPG